MQGKSRQHQLRLMGVTLVEVLIVTVIISILVAVIWLAVGGRVTRASKQQVVASDLRQIVMAINMYRQDNDEGLPVDWRCFGYYGVNKKDKFGKGFPPQDIEFDKPPTYDLSYQTPGCGTQPKVQPVVFVMEDGVRRFRSRPRANVLDVETDPAVQFSQACILSSLGTHPLRIMRNGRIRTYNFPGVKSMSVNLAGSLSYQRFPDWIHELLLGN